MVKRVGFEYIDVFLSHLSEVNRAVQAFLVSTTHRTSASRLAPSLCVHEVTPGIFRWRTMLVTAGMCVCHTEIVTLISALQVVLLFTPSAGRDASLSVLLLIRLFTPSRILSLDSFSKHFDQQHGATPLNKCVIAPECGPNREWFVQNI